MSLAELSGSPSAWLLLVLMALITLLLYLYGVWTFNTWSRLGIPGPKPTAFMGNLSDFRSKGFLTSFEDWRKRYGNTYGIYFTRQPVLVTTDPAILREVMVKQFNDFTERHFISAELTQDCFRSNLFLSGGETWRRFRLAMAPTFTSGKLKAVMRYITDCCENLTSVLEAKARAKDLIDLKDLYQRFTMDVIAGTALGLDTKTLTDTRPEQQQMISAMNEVFNGSMADSFPVLLAGMFPVLAAPLRWLGFVAIPPNAARFFKTFLESLVRQRDSTPANAHVRVDFLQQLLDLRVKSSQHVCDAIEDPSGKKPAKMLTQQEVISSCFNIALAGFETTASALRFLSYNLATHQDVQDKVLAEIQQVVGEGEISYEHLAELKYLDSVILETLRMYPSTPLIGRRAAATVTVKGVTIPQHASIFVPIYSATHDPDNYPDPHLFKPERFEEEHESILPLLPFGLGPRQCIGMRLALLEIKMAVAHVLRRVKFLPCDVTPKNVTFTNRLLLLPTAPIYVTARLRA